MNAQLDKRMQKLILLYAEHPIAGIQSDPSLLENAFGQSLDQLSKQWGFPEAQAFVEDLKERIELQEENLKVPDQKIQVARCLDIVLNLVMFDESPIHLVERKMAVLRELCFEMIAKPAGWSDKQKKHFDVVSGLLKECCSCFLSYTNEGAKGINHKFRQVIDLYVDKAILDKRDHNQHNLLADAVLNRLKSNNLRLSFFDKSDIKKNDNLMDKIRPACEKTFAFIQLVQRETFKAVERRNWCFEEYQLFVGSQHKRLKDHQEYENIFKLGFSPVHTDVNKNQLMAAQQPFEYAPWIQCIFDQQHFTVLPVVPEAFDETMYELSCAIVDLQRQIIEQVPA